MFASLETENFVSTNLETMVFRLLTESIFANLKTNNNAMLKEFF